MSDLIILESESITVGESKSVEAVGLTVSHVGIYVEVEQAELDVSHVGVYAEVEQAELDISHVGIYAEVDLISHLPVGDSITVGDSPTVEITIEIAENENVTVGEYVEAVVGGVNASDTITVSDTANALVIPLVSESETITVGEFVDLAIVTGVAGGEKTYGFIF